MSKNRTDFEGVKNIVLDVGGILVGYRWYDMLKSHGFSHEEIMDFADTVFPDPLWAEFDLENVPYDHVVNQYIEKYPRASERRRFLAIRGREGGFL